MRSVGALARIAAVLVVLAGCGTPAADVVPAATSALPVLASTSAEAATPTTLPPSTTTTTVAATTAPVTSAPPTSEPVLETTSTTAVVESDPVVVVSALRRDADGNDNLEENKNDEWVEITNQGPGDADLTGWWIEDEGANHTFRFPAGFVLSEGAAVKVRSGCGADSETDLYWCSSGSAVWNNDGDTAFLFSPSGDLADTS